jgi:DNA replicative helicase MCM subunit Mcm2 (Cdc46/Mcm family)
LLDGASSFNIFHFLLCFKIKLQCTTVFGTAARLVKSAIKQAATDARIGLVDTSVLTEGTSVREYRRKQEMRVGVGGEVEEATSTRWRVEIAETAK